MKQQNAREVLRRDRERFEQYIPTRKEELCVCAYRRVTSLLVVVFKRTDRAAMVVVWVTVNIFSVFVCVGVLLDFFLCVSTSTSKDVFFFKRRLGFEEKSYKP